MGSYFDYGYDYGEFGGRFGDSDFMAVLGIFLGFIAVFALIAGAIGVVWYILRSIGLYKLSENRGMSGSALAWIPFVGFYRIGSIADDIVARNGGKSNYRHILLIGGIVNVCSGIVSWLVAAFGHSLLLGYNNVSPFAPHGRSFFTDYSSLIPYWGVNLLLSLVSIAIYVFTLIALNKIYKCYRPMSSTSWTVLSAIFPFMQSIFPFTLRNAAPVSDWSAQNNYYPMQNTMPNQNWQAPPPPQYPPYGRQPYANNGYPPQNQDWQSPPPPADAAYQPPVAPNPPEPWEVEAPSSQQPPQAPWDQNNNGNS